MARAQSRGTFFSGAFFKGCLTAAFHNRTDIATTSQNSHRAAHPPAPPADGYRTFPPPQQARNRPGFGQRQFLLAIPPFIPPSRDRTEGSVVRYNRRSCCASRFRDEHSRKPALGDRPSRARLSFPDHFFFFLDRQARDWLSAVEAPLQPWSRDFLSVGPIGGAATLRKRTMDRY